MARCDPARQHHNEIDAVEPTIVAAGYGSARCPKLHGGAGRETELPAPGNQKGFGYHPAGWCAGLAVTEALPTPQDGTWCATPRSHIYGRSRYSRLEQGAQSPEGRVAQAAIVASRPGVYS